MEATGRKVWEQRVLILILLIGFLWRFYELGERFSWGVDQSLAVWPVVKLFEERRLTLIGVHFMNPKSGLFRPPFFTYLLLLPWWLFNFNPLALEAMFALLGILTIGGIYFLGKGVFSQRTAWLAALWYAVSAATNRIDKTVHTITPVIITTVFFLGALGKYRQTGKKRYLGLAGGLVGLGMSFHFQAIILCLAGIVFLHLGKGALKEKLKKNLIFLTGFLLLMAPLLVFNLRHDWIMVEGFRRTFFSQEVIYAPSRTLIARFNSSVEALADLALMLLPLPKRMVQAGQQGKGLIFLIAVILPGWFLLIKERKPAYAKLQRGEGRWLVSFYSLVVFVSLVSLAFVNQGYYGDNSFYLWFMIPLLILVWARCWSFLFDKSQLKILGFFWLGWLLVFNYYDFKAVAKGNYLAKRQLVEEVFNFSGKKYFVVKFRGVDVLDFDYLFFFEGRKRGIDYGQFSLLEEWQEGEGDWLVMRNRDDLKIEAQLREEIQVKEFGGFRLIKG